MSWGAVAVAGASLVGGALSADAAKDAASAQGDASAASAQVQQHMYDTTRSDLEPWKGAGTQALGTMRNALFNGDYSQFYKSPDYQFRLSEGNKALDRSGAARGMALSGAQLKALNRYNSDMASTEYNNWYNKLYDISSSGQNAAAQVGAAGSSAAQGISNSLMAGGNARASGYINKANSYNNALGGLVGAYGMYQGGK